MAFTIGLDADVSFANMIFCTFNDIYYLSATFMASNTKQFALSRLQRRLCTMQTAVFPMIQS